MAYRNMGPGRPRFARRGSPPEVVPVSVSHPQRQMLYMAASLCLDYPREGFEEHMRAVSDATAQFPEPLASRFADFCSWALTTGRRGVEETYVRTFDEQRRCALELSYYAVGDTRQRGQALLAFRELLRAADLSRPTTSFGPLADDPELWEVRRRRRRQCSSLSP